MTHLLALFGVLSISFSAVFIRLARVSPVTATFYRAVYALPVLAAVWWAGRAADDRTGRDRLLAFASGLGLAADLNLWHESIALVGAGLGTVIPNVQIVFIALFGWLRHAERPRWSTLAMIGVVLAGVTLTSGLGQEGAYGTRPVQGVLLGVAAGFCYSVYLIVFRASNRRLVPPAGPLFDATLGMGFGALLSIGLDAQFTFAVSATAHWWLLALAIISQVIGWLFIGTALPRLPAIATSVMLLIQPVFAIVWGLVIFDERLSAAQWLGSAIVLAGVAILSIEMTRQTPLPASRRA
ncbi:MAG TPA: DMT family transporter [Vicinamibacterales bacterium]|nr:DMT family transporter [Vicinamibacterales bacterium]